MKQMKNILTQFLVLAFVFMSIAVLTGCHSVQTEKTQTEKTNKLLVGLYIGQGSRGAGAVRWALLLKNSPDVELRLLDGKDLAGDNLKGLDLFVMPGGSSKQQWKSMQAEKGAENLKKYVRNGGKYFGTCAGMSVILNEPNRVTMLPYKLTPGGSPGGITASVKLTEEGAKQLGLSKNLMMRFHSGPIVKSTAALDMISCEILGYFETEFNQYGSIQRPMYHTPAIFHAHYDKGELFVTNCHPEIFTETHPLLISGIRLLTGRTIRLVYPQKKQGAIRVGFDCSLPGGKKPISNLFALDKRADIDVVPVTGEDINAGILEHLDYYFVKPSRNSDLFKARKTGPLIKAFVERGGKIVRSVDEIK